MFLLLSSAASHIICRFLFLLLQFYSLQRQINERSTDINQLKQERQKLLGLIRSLENDIEDLKRQISGHEKTNQDKVVEIEGLKTD